MASSKRHCTAVLLVLAAQAAGGGASRADEAFLCGTDTVVYVKSEDLDEKKRTDPCIAAYFGLKVEKAVTSAPGAPAAKSGKRPVLRALEVPEKSEPVSPAHERSASISPPAASAGTDFRNIRVINAASADAQWFRHQK